MITDGIDGTFTHVTDLGAYVTGNGMTYNPSDGTVRLYRNLGALFADGFESGDTENWSYTNP